MLPKITHYASFQSYGQLPYPTIKPGKENFKQNEMYQATKRDLDHQDFYENYKNCSSTYQITQIENIVPEQYSKTKLQTKNTWREKQAEDELKKTQIAAALGQTQSSSNQNDQQKLLNETSQKEKRLLVNGTEHWKSTYLGQAPKPLQYAKAQQPDWSKHKEAYYVDLKQLPTEYGTKYGQRGTKPTDLMNKTSAEQPKIFDDLKMGTTQCGKHVPGYTGFIPHIQTASKAFDHGYGEHSRQTFLKQNIVENYQTRIPGYAGHKPHSAVNQKGHLREECFSTQGETFS